LKLEIRNWDTEKLYCLELEMDTLHFLKKNKGKIILLVNLILVSSLSFMAGAFYIHQQTNHHKIKFENAGDICSDFFIKDITENNLKETVQNNQNKNTSPLGVGESKLKNYAPTKKNISDKKEGVFVGSKNSKIYHKPDCPYAKKILEKNKIWFSSREDAENKGYHAGKCCHQ